MKLKLDKDTVIAGDTDDSLTNDDLDSSQNSSDISQKATLVSLDGIHSGVPTRTTATLTPTTLRNIEQTFFELTNDPPATVPCQAGFVPPLPSFTFDQDHQDNSLGSTGSTSNSSWQTPPQAIQEEEVTATNKKAPTKRNMGGRRPKNAQNLTPEEEAKRKVRRERNKLAAARCRKRRVDQTNELVDKVEQLERDRLKLQNEIQELQIIKQDLEFCLDNHRAQCRLITNIGGRKSPLDVKPIIVPTLTIAPEKIKTEPIDPTYDGPPLPKKIFLSNADPVITADPSSVVQSLTTPTITKPSRPSSLNVPLTITPSQVLANNKNIADIAGVSIITPSTGVIFNFDSLMDGGTGLTPVSQPLMPNCSSQNRNPLDLATPTTDPSKLVSL